jgi:DNA-binding HxlR family transcriptional regulator
MKIIAASTYEKESNVMERISAGKTLCPIARSEAEVGDRWTVLILRELFMRGHRFEEIQAQTGGTPQMIAARLKKLQEDGLVERRRYTERPPRYEYHLTEKGEAFYPVILALRACGGPAGLGPVCESCGEPLQGKDLIAELNPPYRSEREERAEAFRANR